MKNKKVLLVGNTNQHTVEGEFNTQLISDGVSQVEVLNVEQESLLKHESPNGGSSNEHKTLRVPKGVYEQGTQVEYNPFDKKISRVWD